MVRDVQAPVLDRQPPTTVPGMSTASNGSARDASSCLPCAFVEKPETTYGLVGGALDRRQFRVEIHGTWAAR